MEDETKQKIGANGYISMASGALSLIDTINQTVRDAKNWSADIPNINKDINGMPIYDLGNARNKLNEFDTADVGKGLGMESALKGASAMSATGNPLAMAGGAIVGGVAGLIGRRRARRQAERRKSEESREFSRTQGMYNTQLKDYDLQQDAKQQAAAGERKRYEMLANVL
jgi:hypothetical protein